MQYASVPERYWWAAAVVGVVSILFGLAALFWPALALFTLVVLFGVYAIVSGIVEFVAMFRAIGQHKTWWTHLVLGLLSVGAGILVFAYPGITTFALMWIIAIWALAIGLTEIIAAFMTGQFMLAVSGLISVLFGLVLFANPGAGALALVLVIGIFAIIRGSVLLVHAIRAPSAPALR